MDKLYFVNIITFFSILFLRIENIPDRVEKLSIFSWFERFIRNFLIFWRWMYRKLFLLIFLLSFIFADPPTDWDTNGDGLFDNVNAYQNSMSLTSAVFIDGVNAGRDRKSVV